MLAESDKQALIRRFSRGETTAMDVRMRLGGATYGDLLQMVAELGLTMPRPSEIGREQQLATARAWMFPDHVR